MGIIDGIAFWLGKYILDFLLFLFLVLGWVLLLVIASILGNDKK